jgi:hypothetical protein
MIDTTYDQTTVHVIGRMVEDDNVIHARVRAEYLEMPGLSLTLPQAARLFNVPPARCARVLHTLVTDGALWTNGRQFLGRDTGRRFA